jgi:hypothetical protein
MADRELSRHPSPFRERVNRLAAWLVAPKEKYRLNTSPILLATSLHKLAERDDPRVALETLHMAEALHSRFREKVFLYREANILQALLDRVKPPRNSGKNGDPLFKPVFLECERTIFGELPNTLAGATKRKSVKAALKDLRALRHPRWGNRYDLARGWSRDWFADIGYNEMNPEILEQFSSFWFDEYISVQKRLEAAVMGT